MSSLLITLEISDYIPQNFIFDNFSFIFNSDSHDFEDEISFISHNQITHKSPLTKKDIRYSIKVLRNDSLIGISDFIIPAILLNRKDNFFENICLINMTDSTKRLLFGNVLPSNNLRIKVRANINYIQEKANIRQGIKNIKKPFSPKSIGFNSKKNLDSSGSPKINNNTNYNMNNGGNSNFVFNKQQIPMSKKIPKNNYTGINNNINIGSRYNKQENIADIILQQEQKPNNSNRPKNFFQKNIPNQKQISQGLDDPSDTSLIDSEISNPILPTDIEFTEFMPKFIEKNPLEQLSQFNDINEMMTYTKNVIEKLLCYQQEYYERLKSSVALNNRLNEILMKYNEKYRNIVKKVHRLNEETNSNDMRKDAVINVHRTENSNLKQIIPLKMKELKLYQEMCGEGIKELLINKNKKNINEEKKVNEERIKRNALMKLIKNCVQNYGSFDTLFKGEFKEEQKERIEIIKEELANMNIEIKSDKKKDINNINDINYDKEEKEDNDLEFVITENPDELDIKLNHYLISIYSENRFPKINFKKIQQNLYEYGTQRITVIEEDNLIKIQYEEGSILLDNFIEINSQAEEEKIKQIN